MDLLIAALNEGKDLAVRRVCFPGDLPLIPVSHILLGNLIAALFHDPDLYHILDIFHIYRKR